jgi:hypothetical protein
MDRTVLESSNCDVPATMGEIEKPEDRSPHWRTHGAPYVTPPVPTCCRHGDKVGPTGRTAVGAYEAIGH